MVLLLSAASVAFARCQTPSGDTGVEGERSRRGLGFDPAPVEIPTEGGTAARPIKSGDLLSIIDVRGIQISPDGKSIAFVVSQAVSESNNYRTGMFVVSTTGGTPIKLGSAGPPHWDDVGQYRSEAPTWSPDSRYITYRLRANGRWQIWRWNREGGNPIQLTHCPYDIQSFEWSPDGSKIIFVTEKPRDPGEVHRLAGTGVLYDKNIRPWESDPIEEAELERKPKATETWVYDVASGTEEKATGGEIKRHLPWQKDPNDHTVLQGRVSPDGKLLAYTAYVDDEEKSAHLVYPLFVRSIAGGKPMQITAGSYSVGEFWWAADSSQIFLTEYSGDGRSPKLLEIPARGGPPRQILHSDDWISQYSVDTGGTFAACVRQNLTTPEEVAVVNMKTGVVRTLVNVNPQFQNIQLSPATRMEWKNKYGESGFGYLVKPLNYEPGKAYPLIVTTYRAGEVFLRGAVGDEYPIQVFAANGFAVLDFDVGFIPNVKPGDFHGAVRRWYSPLASLEAALKVVEGTGVADPQHRGLTGLSFGAEIVEFTISHADFFQAAIDSGGGARDPYFYYLGGKGWHERFAEWGLGGSPEGEASARWHEMSPALNAAKIKAPLLVNAADSEFRIELQLYTLLEELHKPVEMFIYPEELHIKYQPKNKLEIYERNLDWFKFWLKGEEDPDPAKNEQYKRWRELRKRQELGRKNAFGSSGP